MKKTHFDNLDSLRTIAFLSIFLHHGFYTESTALIESSIFKTWELIKAPAGFGVPLFFVLSGFLITYLILEERAKTGKFNIGNFYVRRVLRIWPLYYVVVAFGFLGFPFIRNLVDTTPYLETANPFMYALFMGNFDQIAQMKLPYGVGLGVTWSLSVEEQFYLFWPVIFLLFKKHSNLIKIITGVIILAVISKYFWVLDDKHTLVCMAYLGSGALLANLIHSKSKILERIQQLPKWFTFIIYIVGGVFLYIHPHIYPQYTYPISIAFIGLFFSFVIFDQGFSTNSFIKLKKIPFLEKLGKYTYGLYLVHTISNFLIFTIFQFSIFKNIIPELYQSMILRPILSLLLSIILAILSYHFFEKPFLKLKNKFNYLSPQK